MRVVLVHMPWGAVEVPSLALGILTTAAERRGHNVTVRYANLSFVDWAVAELGLSLADYRFLSETTYFDGAGDWVFAGALYGHRARQLERLSGMLSRRGADAEQIRLCARLYQTAPSFLARLAADLDGDQPDVVGFTSTFQQNVASLAAAKLIKARRPAVRTVLGGANCDGPQGAALHRNFPFVDFVVRGEGERALPMLLDAVSGDAQDYAGIPGLCWRAGSGASVANPMTRHPLPPDDIVAPRYGDFFDRLDASAAAGWVAPRLVVEGSRGCWWGEKHHCTFCGLNGSFMEFRSKSPERFYTELIELARRHHVLDFLVVDNILDMRYFGTVLARLAESGYDVRLHFEVKSNLRRHQFQQLRDAGVVLVQPGIESLSTRVLRIMDKGVSGCLNVRALRDAESAGISAGWNYLYGFPGESPQDYTTVIDQMARLHHLMPPLSTSRIAIERFSPYFNRPELGFAQLRPAPHYREIYPLPEQELADLAYIFTAPPQGISADLADKLSAAVQDWQVAYPRSRLSYQDLGDRIVVVSRRPAYSWSVLELDTDLECALFRLLDQPHSIPALVARARLLGSDPGRVEKILDHWCELGILYADDGKFIQVAMEAHNQPLMRIDNAGTEYATAS